MSAPQQVVGQPVNVVHQPQQPIQYVPPQQPMVAAQPAQGGVVYYPTAQPGAQQVVYVTPMSQPNYNYTPNDFFTLSVVTAVLCGLFSPLTLFLTIPAVMFSNMSQQSAKAGDIDKARQQGMTAAYLVFAAVTGALVVACICTGLVLGLYGPVYARYN